MVLILHVPGASPEALARGLAVAQEVLTEAGISVAEAALGYRTRARAVSDAASSFVTDDTVQAAAAFSLAQAAAIDTCCEGKPAPAGSRLQALDA